MDLLSIINHASGFKYYEKQANHLMEIIIKASEIYPKSPEHENEI